MRTAYIETLSELAKNDKNVYAMISDNGAIVYDEYRKAFPEQYINAGISEANMVAMAAGLASRGKIPFAYTIGAFLAYRAYEFILNDVCLQNLNVKLVGIGAGCSYSLLGPSHHAIYDLAVLRPLPNLTVFSPASPMEVREVVKAAYEIEGPVYIRLGTNREKEIYEAEIPFQTGKGRWLKNGEELSVTFVTTGSIAGDVLIGSEKLEQQGINAGVINIHTICPFDDEIIKEAAKKSKALVVVEEHSVIGGLGSAVAEIIAENQLNVSFKRIGLHDFVEGYGKHAELKMKNGLGIEKMVKTVSDINIM